MNKEEIYIEAERAAVVLKNGGTLLFPTDTVWGIGGDACNPETIKKVYALKQRSESKALICLIKDLEMLRRHIEKIPSTALPFLEAKRPTTVIFSNPKGLPEALIAEDHSIAFRIPDDLFCQKLLHHFDGPIIATSANISQHPTPKQFDEIDPVILKGVDYIVPLAKDQIKAHPSRIIKFDPQGNALILRD
jgi:L-threonylcarbamoyladenylate synthase